MFTKIINYENNFSPSEQPSAVVPLSRIGTEPFGEKRSYPLQTTDWRTRRLHAREEIPPVIEEILPLLEAAGYSGKERFAVQLSVEEALVNAIKHGHKDDPSKEVQLRFHLAPKFLLVEIEDQGPGFKPEDVPDPFAPENLERSSGRGLLLMRNYMTWVRFNDAGNRVTMCRQRLSA